MEAYDEKLNRKQSKIVSTRKNVMRIKNRVYNTGDIAVIGFSCRFPGAMNASQFWDNLKKGVTSITEIPRERWNIDTFYSPNIEDDFKSISKYGGFIDDVDLFDAKYFRISEERAKLMEPQQRLMLEISAEAINQAGYTRKELSGSQTSVFIGAVQGDYGSSNENISLDNGIVSDGRLINHRNGFLGSLPNMIPSIVSNYFNLMGPSVTVSTACSSSLVSIHLACQSILSGESKLAIAGGIQLYLSPIIFIGTSKTGALSSDGKCRTFSKDARGYVLSEGVGVCLLKRLEDAVNDGDTIYAIIKSSAVNNDGKTVSIIMPNAYAQQNVILQALEKGGIDAASISYFEANGTAMRIGDPLEVKAAASAYKKYTDETQYCTIGSVEQNIGHAAHAAGIASLIKVLLCLLNKQIPPALYCDELNPDIDFPNTPFCPNRKLIEWRPRQNCRRAGINAFGFGGTNCHVILEDFDPEKCDKYKVIRKSLPPIKFIKKRYWLNDGEQNVLSNILSKDVAKTYEDLLLQKFQKDLKKHISKISKVEEKDIDLDGDMGDYNFDSISFTKLASRINETFNLEITPAIFFEHPSIDSFVRYLCKEYKDNLLHHYRDSLKALSTMVQEEQSGPAVEEIKLRTCFQPLVAQEAKSESRIQNGKESVAIVGMSGMMPQSEDLEIFWKHLEEGKDLITEIPKDRWDWQSYYGDPSKEVNKSNVKWGGFINDVDKFDALFFGISPREADLMDPQQRIFLETVWKTIEDAGYKPSNLSGTKTGLFVGAIGIDYFELLKDHAIPIEAHLSTGIAHSIIANRISYLLDLRGPSEAIDTACSSSLVAVHRAVQAIRNGNCEMAIAGGVNIIIRPTVHIALSKAGMLCEDGRCKTFDKRANGYVRGEGTGAILLKPLKRAIADGDYIYAVIKGTAENHGGRANSLTAPNPNAQGELLITAYEEAKIDPSTVSYIEAHGTGTSLGDPIEVNGLKKAFAELFKRWDKKSPKEAYCGIGSVKTNIGHLESAAGIAGVIKVLLSMKYKKLPASINFEELNPYIKLQGSPFYIVNETKSWECLRNDGDRPIPRRAGISSFGFGGTNAHIVLEEYEKQILQSSQEDYGRQIITLSAKNEERLRAYAGEILEFLEKENKEEDDIKVGVKIADIAYTLQVGREAMEERLAILVSTIDELKEKLTQYCQDKLDIENLYQGNIKTNRAEFALLVEGEEGEAFLKTLINKRKLSKLSQLWVAGVEIDLSLLYKEMANKPNRISLPTYPFIRKRYWAIPEVPYGHSSYFTDEKVNINYSLQRFFYYPRWVEEPLSGAQSHQPEIVKKSKEEKRAVLFIYSQDALILEEALAKAHKGAEIYKIKLGSVTRRYSEKSWQVKADDPGALDIYIRQLSGIHTIYFLGGIQAKHIDMTNLDSLKQSQEKGVLSLFRLIKSLSAQKVIHFPLQLKVVTNDVHQDITDREISKNDKTNPFSASLYGLTRVMAKEYPHIEISCMDVSLDEIYKNASKGYMKEVVKSILAESGKKTVIDVAIRNGKRYVQRIEPIQLSPINKSPFRPQGVYLIVGGAGGIGLELSRFLAETVQARLVLVGRSKLTEEKKEKIAQIEAKGGEVLYLQADVTDLASIKVAVQKAKSSFGKIHGVIHSAVALKDKSLENMDEGAFLSALTPKVRGSVVLAKVMEEEQLDFMIFFSSAVSFFADAGQGNYAAGCTFKDAFARYLDQHSPYPVHIINWGYWGSVGVAATEYYQKLFAKRGILSIEPSEGMEAISRILSHQITQVAVIKLKNQVSDKITAVTHPQTESINMKVSSSEVLKKSSPIDKLEEIYLFLREIISEITGIDKNKINSNDEWSEMGMDSILNMKLVQRIEEQFELRLYANELLEYNTAQKLADYLKEELAKRCPENIANLSGDNNIVDANIKSTSIRPLIFLLSTPRAGSTLIRAMLMGHSQFFAPPELHLLNFNSLKERAEVLNRRNQAFFKEGLIEAIGKLESIPAKEAIRKMQKLEEKDLSIKDTYALLKKLAGGKFLVDKSPSYAYDIRALERAEKVTKNPFYIFLVRHPISVIESFVRNRFDKMLGIKGYPWGFAEKLWRDMNNNIRVLLAKIPKNRWIQIHFEELVRDPEKVMKFLCGRLGVDFEESLLYPYDGDRMTKGLHNSSLSIGDPNFLNHHSIDSKYADAWKRHMDKLDSLHYSTIKLAQELDYSIAIPNRFELSPSQKAFMNHFEEDPLWYIVQSFTIRMEREFNLHRFKNSLQKVIHRHAELRAYFLKEKGQWYKYEQKEAFLEIIYEDLSNLDQKVRHARLMSLERELPNRVNIDSAPLMACEVVKIDRNQHRVIMVIHHLIADGLTLSVIFQDFLDFYWNPEKNNSCVDHRFKRYIKEITSLERSTTLKEHLKFWTDHIQDRQMKCPIDRKKGLNKMSTERDYKKIYSFKEINGDSLAVKAKMFDYFSVSLYLYFASWTKQTEPIIVHRLHCRNLNLEEQYNDVAGWFAGDIPFCLPVFAGDSIQEQILYFQDLKRKIPMGGVTYEMLANQGLLPYAHQVGSIRFNYQPDSFSPKVKDIDVHLFESPNHDRLYMLDLIVRMKKDHFKVIVRYSKNFHKLNSIRRLVQEWMDLTKTAISDDQNAWRDRP